jgi:hypothetical protein
MKRMVELNERYHDVTYRFMVVKAAKCDYLLVRLLPGPPSLFPRDKDTGYELNAGESLTVKLRLIGQGLEGL